MQLLFIMITLVELGAVFWVGAQLWLNFVQTISSEKHTSEQAINEQAQARFERRFSLPTLLVILLANVGVLVGQALNQTGGNWGQAFAVLNSLATQGRFGIFWLISESVLVVAIAISLFTLIGPAPPRWASVLLPMVNLLLGLLLFLAITMISHAAVVADNLVTLAIIVDWLHLLAAAMWIGFIFYIAAIYLPILARQSGENAARSLITVLPYSLPLVIAGVVIMAITGPLSATFHLTSGNQLTQTAYGRVLLVKTVLVVGLLITGGMHIFLLRPRLQKEYRKYSYAISRLTTARAAVAVEARQTPPAGEEIAPSAEPGQSARRLEQQVRLREKRLGSKTRQLTTTLRWEPLLGIAILVCAGLLNVFAGTLSAAATTPQKPGAKPQPYMATLKTVDSRFSAKLEINPNLFGMNVFTVTVIDNSTGQADTNVSVTVSMTMLDMDMGTQSVNLRPDGKGHFSANGELSMEGRWQIRVQIRTPDSTLHEVSTNITTPF